MTEDNEKTKDKKKRDPNAYPDRLIQVGEVIQLTSLSRTQIYRLCTDPKYAYMGFPKAIPLGLSRRAWSLPAVRRWITERAAQAAPQLEEASAS